MSPLSAVGAIAGAGGLGNAVGSATGLGDIAGNAILQGTTSAAGAALNGASFGDILKTGGIGALSGAAGGYAGDAAGGFIKDSGIGAYLGKGGERIVGDVAKSFAGNLAGNATGSLLSGKGLRGDMLKSAALAAATGGLGSAAGQGLNTLFNPTNDRTQQKMYNKLASQIASTGSSIYKQKQKNNKLEEVYNKQNLQKQKLANQLQQRLARA